MLGKLINLVKDYTYLRAFFLAILAIFVFEISEVHLNYIFVLTSALVGNFFALLCTNWWMKYVSEFSYKNLILNIKKNKIRILVGAVVLILLANLLNILPALFLSPYNKSYLFFEQFKIDLFVAFYLFIFFFLSGFFFLYFENYLFWESVLLFLVIIFFFSDHQDYNFDKPKIFASYIWNLNIKSENSYIFFAGLVSLCSFCISILISKRRLVARRSITNINLLSRLSTRIAFLILLIAVILGSSFSIIGGLNREKGTQSQGVGEGSKEGQSPLSFKSSVGKIKQPAALVKLEGGYEENPLQPMLYFRENALSLYNGRELVISSRNYDKDVPRLPPGERYQADNFIIGTRKELDQSIFLITKHDLAFSADQVKRYIQLKNPNHSKFTLAYKATSLVNILPLDEILNRGIGDTEWSSEELSHYLKAPGSDFSSSDEIKRLLSTKDYDLKTKVVSPSGEDLRYLLLAKEIEASLINGGVDYERLEDGTVKFAQPLLVAKAITDWLAKNSLYTRSPGHEVGPNEDPIAPYLFSDTKRGYCVHFAHAATYLFRLLKIPARVATGYLADLRYAKDAHILLHLGDRHAWPEVFVQGVGWVPFDVTPENAENEQALVPDEDLLQDLMTKIKPEDLIEDSSGDISQDRFLDKIINILRAINYPFIFMALIFILFCIKLILYFGYMVFRKPAHKLTFFYYRYLVSKYDLFSFITLGETPLEFAGKDIFKMQASSLITLYYKLIYSSEIVSRVEVDMVINNYLRSLRVKDYLLLILVFMNPISIFLIPFFSFIKNRYLLSSKIKKLVLALLLCAFSANHSLSQEMVDVISSLYFEDEYSGDEKSDSLINSAKKDFLSQKGVDGRSKLEEVLRFNPSDYRARMLLGNYYLTEIGHFKLAYRYISEAEKIIKERFSDEELNTPKSLGWKENAKLLYLKSEASLNLDEYSESLEVLERFEKKYWDSWLASSKSWILMKLDRDEEAIEIAKAGILDGAEPLRTLNILGILYSVSYQYEESLKIFRQAIAYERFALGRERYSTPLNNASEVYRELFDEASAEAALQKVISMADGCDNILPSINLNLTYIDQGRFFEAESILREFEKCFKNYGDKQDSEFRALLRLGLGRAKLYQGDIKTAYDLVLSANKEEQWFGRIGTTQDDFKFAARIGLARVSEAYISYLDDRADGYLDKIKKSLSKYKLASTIPLLYLEAVKIGIDKNNGFEDLNVRSSDAMIEYPTLGRALSFMTQDIITNKLDALIEKDKRAEADAYYSLYKQQISFKNSNVDIEELKEVLKSIREEDVLLKLEAKILLIKLLERERKFLFLRDTESFNLAKKYKSEIFQTYPQFLRFDNVKLPVKFKNVPSSMRFKLESRFEDEISDLVLEYEEINGIEILRIYNSTDNTVLVEYAKNLEKTSLEFVDKFVDKAFQHKFDAKVKKKDITEILDGVFNDHG